VSIFFLNAWLLMAASLRPGPEVPVPVPRSTYHLAINFVDFEAKHVEIARFIVVLKYIIAVYYYISIS